MPIKFRDGYKYQLAETYSVNVGIYPSRIINTDFLNLDLDGILTMKKGYAWDGPSGPAIDTKTFMRASLVHDALYQLMRLGYLSTKAYRGKADEVLRQICKEDGMWKPRQWWVFRAVRKWAETAADPSSIRPIRTAP